MGDPSNGQTSNKVKFSRGDLGTFSEAVKEAGRNLKQASWEYGNFGPIERKTFVEKTDKFFAALNRSWQLMRQAILDD